jgi:hypothetical protein
MFTKIIYSLRRQAVHFGSRRRIEVCPPALLQGTVGLSPGWRGWLQTGWNASAGGAPGQPQQVANGSDDPRLRRVRDEFLQSLQDIRTQQVGMLQGRIRIARSLRELWHLRPEVFKLVALHFSQAEAQCRLDRLNRHFPTRSPRSGFGLLDGPPARDRNANRS